MQPAMMNMRLGLYVMIGPLREMTKIINEREIEDKKYSPTGCLVDLKYSDIRAVMRIFFKPNVMFLKKKIQISACLKEVAYIKGNNANPCKKQLIIAQKNKELLRFQIQRPIIAPMIKHTSPQDFPSIAISI